MTTASCGTCYGVGDLIATVFGAVNVSGVIRSTDTEIGRTSFTFDNFGSIGLTPSPTRSLTIAPSLTTSLSLISPSEYIVLSAYSVTSALTVNGACSTSSGLPVTTGPFSFTIDASTADDLNTFSAAQSFVQFLQLSCSGGGTEPIVTPILTSFTSTTPTILPNTTSPASSSKGEATTLDATTTSLPQNLHPSGSDTGEKIGAGVGVPVGGLVIVLLTALIWNQRRRGVQETRASAQATKKPRKRWRIYFQEKGELDAEEQRRNEMEASEIRREIDGHERHELEAEDTRQELVGDDHVQEVAP